MVSFEKSFRTHNGPLKEMSTRNTSWVKAAGALGLKNYHLHVTFVLTSGRLIILEKSGPVHAFNWIVYL
jgi:hypothetical protein